MAESALQLSDEEFMKQGLPEDVVEEAPTEKEEAPVTDTADNTAKEDDKVSADPDATGKSDDETGAKAPDSEAQEEPDADSTKEVLSQPDGDTQTEHEPSEDGTETESLDTSDQDKTDTNEDTQETAKFDYESAYKKVTEPFKANGSDMTVTDPNDIVRLMQMGANYSQKMAQLKPNLRIIKMLENNGLLDEATLGHLIDLSKKDPKAVAKLVKESGIDPSDIDTETAENYRPTDYSVSEKEFDLDTVLDSIKDTETFSQTIQVLTKEWDAASKAVISDNPEIISVVNSHMANGVYAKVNGVLQSEKALGKLAGISDVEAYRQIADHLFKTGQLKDETPSEDSKVSSDDETDPLADAERNKKRAAVAPVSKSPVKPKTGAKDEDFLGLSDADFMKKFGSG